MALHPDGLTRMIASNSDSGAIGPIPYRLGLAGGWIDQPFVSEHDPEPPGSMVVVGLEPTVRFMERSGIATSTRKVACELWPDGFPDRPLDVLVRELYAAENRDKSQPSGSQDMVGLIYPGVSRLDYDFAHEGGVFPKHIESSNDPEVATWLERVVHIIPIAARPDGYDPLGEQDIDPGWVRRLGQTGRDCYDAILARDVHGLGAAMNECMRCWSALLPGSFTRPALTVDLPGILAPYQERYPGAAYACSGGGYLYVASEEPVPRSFNATVRLAADRPESAE